MTTGIQLSCFSFCFEFFWLYIPRSRIAEPYDNTIFSLLRILQTVLMVGCIILYFTIKLQEFQVFLPNICYFLLLLMLPHPSLTKSSYNVGFHNNSIIINDVEKLSIYILATCIALFGEMSIQILDPFQKLIFLPSCYCVISLYTLWILTARRYANIFSYIA